MDLPEIKAIMDQIYAAMEEKGYSPIYQFVGYILENDPTYITNHNNARTLIKQMDRKVLVYELLSYYFTSKA